MYGQASCKAHFNGPAVSPREPIALLILGLLAVLAGTSAADNKEEYLKTLQPVYLNPQVTSMSQ